MGSAGPKKKKILEIIAGSRIYSIVRRDGALGDRFRKIAGTSHFTGAPT